MYTSDETTFAHDCSNQRVYDPVSKLDIMNPESTNMAQLWLTVSRQMLARIPYKAVFEDDTNDVYETNTMPCSFDPNAWLSASVTETATLQSAGFPVIYNGLSLFGPGHTVAPVIALNPYAIGGMMENCYMRPGPNSYTYGLGWATIANTEIQMAQQHKYFFCYADDYTQAASQDLSLRTFAFASYLLSYDPNTSIFESNFINKNDFNVMPESEIVALNPLTPAPLTAANLLTSTGVYGREYAACYLHGQYVGKCAAVVNADAFHSYAFPYSGYTRTMTISGGDVLSGGSISVNGSAPSGMMAPLAAVVAFK